MANPEVILEAKGITKKFPGVLANDNVDFDLHKGEIHALLGENGAGKSTLMNVLAGLYKQDAGIIKVKGNMCEFDIAQADGQGLGEIRKSTGFVTNAPEIAKKSARTCSGKHRHIQLVGGRTKAA